MIRWVTELVGTAAYGDLIQLTDVRDCGVIDVRELRDGRGNQREYLVSLINNALEMLRQGRRILVCCDMGVSRSNAIAFGILLASGAMTYDRALQRFTEELGNPDINPDMLREIRSQYAPPTVSTVSPRPRVLVTGAGGFIGKAAMRGLNDEFDLYALDSSQYDLRRDLLRLDRFVDTHGIDAILHLAHPRMRNNTSSLGDALVMTKTVLELCRLRNLGVLFLSNVLAVYGGHPSPDVKHLSDDVPLRPGGTYGESKYLCESLISLYREQHGIRTAVLRPTTVFGHGLEASHFLMKFIEWSRRGVTIRTHQYRNGLPAFDFLEIGDLLEAIRCALRLWPAMPVNVGTGLLTTTAEAARQIVTLTGSSSPLDTLSIDDETVRVSIDIEDAREQLGWHAQVSFDTGLGELCNVWVRNCESRAA